jgi:hypothetical protein
MLLLGLAFGLIEAGLIDQSLFNPDYRAIPYWDNLREPTLVPAIGMSTFMAFDFLGGHVSGSICAPIALAESLVPERRTRPWLGRVGLAVAGRPQPGRPGADRLAADRHRIRCRRRLAGAGGAVVATP